MSKTNAEWIKERDIIRKRARAKHKPGANACGYCQTWDHHKCRPKLNGTLCSCTCPAAVEMRHHHDYKTNQALEAGLPAPNIIETLKELRPGKVWIKYAKEAFNQIDTNK